MSNPFESNNPGIAGLDELTSYEEMFIQDLAALPYSTGDILYYNGIELQNLGIGTNSQVLTVSAGIPSWQDSSGGISGFTNGSVVFIDALGDGTEDNDHFFFDDTNDRLFVGKTLTERLTNPNFTGSATGWTLNTGWVYSSNSVSKTSNGTGALLQAYGLYSGAIYRYSFVVSNLTVGSVTLSCGATTLVTASANGTYSGWFIAPTTAGTGFTLTPTNTARLTIDTCSLQQLSEGGIGAGKLTTKELTLGFEGSNTTPGTTKAIAFDNTGSYTWLDFNFSGVRKATMGALSTGELSFYVGGGSYFALYNNSGNSLYQYSTPTEFVHYGRGQFSTSLNAGNLTPAQSTLQSRGGIALQVKRITSSTTLDNTASKWIIDATNASSCTGTPSTNCSSYSDQSTCEANNAHNGCTWNAGNPCSAFDNESGMGTCSGTSGCTVVTASCAGAGDETSCLAQDDAYGGSCSWDISYADCSAFNADESSCTSTSGCYPNYTNCSWNGSSCDGGGSCSGYFDESSCNSATYFSSCSGNYVSGNVCNGNYNTGGCSGTYGASCTGTADCSGFDNSTNCGNETGCTWSTTLVATLPDISTCEHRDYWIYKDGSTGTVTITPTGSDLINQTTSYSLTGDKEWVHISAFQRTSDCSVFNGDEINCTNTNGCVWSSGDSTCGGTYISSRNWYKFGS
jgi:hypothetical protein